MDLQEMRDYIRVHMDLEVDDLPDALLDIWIRDGSKRVERAESRWPFYEQNYQFSTVAGQANYMKSLIGGDLDQISFLYVADTRPALQWVNPDDIDQLQRGYTGQSRPVYFAEWGDTLTLFPTPDQVYGMNLRGYRRAIDWVANGSGAEPDMPTELHNVIATFALAKAYAQQEDPEMAAFYERQFSDELNEYRRRLLIMPYSQPIVVGGGPLTERPARNRPLFAYPGGVF